MSAQPATHMVRQYGAVERGELELLSLCEEGEGNDARLWGVFSAPLQQPAAGTAGPQPSLQSVLPLDWVLRRDRWQAFKFSDDVRTVNALRRAVRAALGKMKLAPKTVDGIVAKLRLLPGTAMRAFSGSMELELPPPPTAAVTAAVVAVQAAARRVTCVPPVWRSGGTARLRENSSLKAADLYAWLDKDRPKSLAQWRGALLLQDGKGGLRDCNALVPVAADGGINLSVGFLLAALLMLGAPAMDVPLVPIDLVRPTPLPPHTVRRVLALGMTPMPEDAFVSPHLRSSPNWVPGTTSVSSDDAASAAAAGSGGDVAAGPAAANDLKEGEWLVVALVEALDVDNWDAEVSARAAAFLDSGVTTVTAAVGADMAAVLAAARPAGGGGVPRVHLEWVNAASLVEMPPPAVGDPADPAAGAAASYGASSSAGTRTQADALILAPALAAAFTRLPSVQVLSAQPAGASSFRGRGRKHAGQWPPPSALLPWTPLTAPTATDNTAHELTITTLPLRWTAFLGAFAFSFAHSAPADWKVVGLACVEGVVGAASASASASAAAVSAAAERSAPVAVPVIVRCHTQTGLLVVHELSQDIAPGAPEWKSISSMLLPPARARAAASTSVYAWMQENLLDRVPAWMAATFMSDARAGESVVFHIVKHVDADVGMRLHEGVLQTGRFGTKIAARVREPPVAYSASPDPTDALADAPAAAPAEAPAETPAETPADAPETAMPAAACDAVSASDAASDDDISIDAVAGTFRVHAPLSYGFSFSPDTSDVHRILGECNAASTDGVVTVNLGGIRMQFSNTLVVFLGAGGDTFSVEQNGYTLLETLKVQLLSMSLPAAVPAAASAAAPTPDDDNLVGLGVDLGALGLQPADTNAAGQRRKRSRSSLRDGGNDDADSVRILSRSSTDAFSERDDNGNTNGNTNGDHTAEMASAARALHVRRRRDSHDEAAAHEADVEAAAQEVHDEAAAHEVRDEATTAKAAPPSGDPTPAVSTTVAIPGRLGRVWLSAPAITIAMLHNVVISRSSDYAVLVCLVTDGTASWPDGTSETLHGAVVPIDLLADPTTHVWPASVRAALGLRSVRGAHAQLADCGALPDGVNSELWHAHGRVDWTFDAVQTHWIAEPAAPLGDLLLQTVDHEGFAAAARAHARASKPMSGADLAAALVAMEAWTAAPLRAMPLPALLDPAVLDSTVQDPDVMDDARAAACPPKQAAATVSEARLALAAPHRDVSGLGIPSSSYMRGTLWGAGFGALGAGFGSPIRPVRSEREDLAKSNRAMMAAIAGATPWTWALSRTWAAASAQFTVDVHGLIARRLAPAHGPVDASVGQAQVPSGSCSSGSGSSGSGGGYPVHVRSWTPADAASLVTVDTPAWERTLACTVGVATTASADAV